MCTISHFSKYFDGIVPSPPQFFFEDISRITFDERSFQWKWHIRLSVCLLLYLSSMYKIHFLTYLFSVVSLSCFDCMKAIGEGEHSGAFLAPRATALQLLPPLVNSEGKTHN